MKKQLKPYLKHSLVVCAVVLLSAAAAFLVSRPLPVVTQLASKVARVPLGVSASQAEAILGSSPTEVYEAEGVLMNPSTMLDSTNALAKNYGEPQMYTLLVWKRNGHGATVAVNADGNVAGHWVWSK